MYSLDPVTLVVTLFDTESISAASDINLIHKKQVELAKQNSIDITNHIISNRKIARVRLEEELKSWMQNSFTSIEQSIQIYINSLLNTFKLSSNNELVK